MLSTSDIRVRVYEALGMKRAAKEARDHARMLRLMGEAWKKLDGDRPRKITFDEMMDDLRKGDAGPFMDRKIQAFISNQDWPERADGTSLFEKLTSDGWNTNYSQNPLAIQYVCSISEEVDFERDSVIVLGNPVPMTFEHLGQEITVYGRTIAMAYVAAYLVARIGRPDKLDRSEGWSTYPI